MARYNIGELVARYTGISGPYVVRPGESGTLPAFREVEAVELGEAAIYSPLGTPYYDQVRLKGGTIPGTDEVYEGLDLVDAPLIQVSRTKNIVATQIAGRDGTIKELISNGDHQVRIAGVLVRNDSNQPPIEELERLMRLCDLPVALEVESLLLNALGIDSLVIESYDFPASEFINVRPYSLTCVSDTPAEVQILNDL